MISTNNILESRLLDIKPRGYMRYNFQKNTQCSLSEVQFFSQYHTGYTLFNQI